MRRRKLFWMASFAALALAGGARAQEKALNVAVGGAFTSMDPHYHNLNPNNVLAQYVYSALVTSGPKFDPEPGLALSWAPAGETSWEFKLRPNVKFHDGTPFTAEDVAFSFARIPQVLNSPSSFNFAVKPITKLEIVDPLTIRMHTDGALPLLPYMMASPYIVSHTAAAGAGTGDFNSGKAAIGTGPYKLVSIAIGDRAVFRRNDDWWGTKPVWETVNYRVIANNASRTAALQAGDVDIIDQVATRDVASLKTNPKLAVRAVPGQRLIYLYVDTEREPTPFAFDLQGNHLAKNPLKDVRVRKALSLAINRDGIKTQIMDGFAAPTGQLMPEGASGYVPEIRPDPYDPAKARELLAEAGWKDGFALTLHGPNDRYVNDAQILQAIAQGWARIGVKTTVAAAPSSVFFSGAARDEYTIDLTGWASDTGEDSSNLVQIIASSNPEKGRGAVFRASHYANPKADEIIERSLATVDTNQREALYREATKIGMDDQAIIPIHHQVNIWAMRKDLNLRERMQEGIRAWEVTPAQ